MYAIKLLQKNHGAKSERRACAAAKDILQIPTAVPIFCHLFISLHSSFHIRELLIFVLLL